MEANRTSMKCKRLLGVCTRSKSQIHLHRTSSGRVINSDGHANLISSESDRKRPRPIDPTEESSEGTEVLKSVIKDLRVKRVFSQTYKPSENIINDSKSGTESSFSEPDDGSKDAKSDGVEGSGNGNYCSGREIDDSKGEEAEKSELGFLAESPNSADVIPKSPVSEEMGGGSNHEFSLTSAPEVKANGVQLKVDNETKLVLKPRKRVFKAPGSFSYRRMLPYLKDITKDNSCMLDFCELPNREKGLGGEPFLGKLAYANQEGSMHQFTTHKFSREGRTIDSSTRLETVHVSTDKTSHCNEVSSESPEYVPKSSPIAVVDQCLPKPPDGQNENLDVGLSCEVQKLNVSNPFHSSTVEDSQPNKDHVIVMSNDGNTPVENMETAGKDDNVPSSEDKNVKDISPQSSSIMDVRYSCKDNEEVQQKENSNQAQSDMDEQRGGNDEEVLNLIYDLNEESVQMTPPDAEILDKLEIEVKESSRAECVHQCTDQGLGKPSSGFNHRDATWLNVRHESSPKRKLVSNPCSRLKLFKSPGSVSYRRLLPFIMDMEKSASVSGHCESTVKDLEQKKPLTLNQQGTPMDKSNGLIFHPEPGTVPTPQSTTANGSYNYDGPNLTSPEHVTGFQMSFDLQKEMHFQHAMSGKQSKLETSPDIVVSLGHETELPVPILCPKTSESSEKDGARTACRELPVTNLLSVGPVEDYISSRTALIDGEKPVQANSLGHNSSEIDATISSGIQADALRKGILKRNPRGCRGLCSCLNCASFRLHAERAFEFSRNQMQDAEEVALDLMTELSKLRKLLERSAATAKDHVVSLEELLEQLLRDNKNETAGWVLSCHSYQELFGKADKITWTRPQPHGLIIFTESCPVTKACRKASEAEDLARNRLGELNYDLNIHCRITCLHEPRVRFANHIEEKVIPKAKCSSD